MYPTSAENQTPQAAIDEQATVQPVDPLLLPFFPSPDGPEAEELPAGIIREHAEPNPRGHCPQETAGFPGQEVREPEKTKKARASGVFVYFALPSP